MTDVATSGFATPRNTSRLGGEPLSLLLADSR